MRRLPQFRPAGPKSTVDQRLRNLEDFMRLSAEASHLSAADGSDNIGSLPTGGATTQVLTKASDVDFATEWSTIGRLPVGGTAAQVLSKISDVDFDTEWGTIDVDSGTPIFDTQAAAAAATISSDKNALLVAGLAARGDRPTLGMVQVAADPSIADPDRDAGFFQDVGGRWWDQPAPSEFENIDFEYFCRRHNDHATRLRKALATVFNETSPNALVLDCHGIPLNISEPLLLREPELYFHDVAQRHRRIRNVRLKQTVGSHAWAAGDFLFSISGSQTSRMTWVTFENFVIEITNQPIVGFHLAGYQHCILRGFQIRNSNITADSVGIYASKHLRSSGTSLSGQAEADELDGHGLVLENCDIVDLSANLDTASIGFLNENGDTNIMGSGTWFSLLGEGIVSKIGNFNVYPGIHFSCRKNGSGYRRNAIRCTDPNTVKIDGPEIDQGIILFDATADNTGGVARTIFTRINIIAPFFSSTSALAPTGYGLITFRAGAADSLVRNCYITPGAASVTGGPSPNQDVLAFPTDGASGSWDATQAAGIWYVPPRGGGIAPGDLPGLLKMLMVESNRGSVHFSPNSPVGPALIFDNADWLNRNVSIGAARGSGDTSTPPHLFADANTLCVAVGATPTKSWKWTANGGAGFAINGTATAVAGAATLDAMAGVITSESLTTINAGDYLLTITNSLVEATDLCFASVKWGTNTAGNQSIARITPSAGSLAISIHNVTATMNGTIKISFIIFKT